MKIGIVIACNDAETIWNAFRFANFSLEKENEVRVFLLGKGVEAADLGTPNFDIKKQMAGFISSDGKIYSCGTCLKVRGMSDSELCHLSTLNDLYQIIAESDKLITF